MIFRTLCLAVAFLGTQSSVRASAAAGERASEGAKYEYVDLQAELCINQAALPDIFDLRKCLGNYISICESGYLQREEVLRLANCTVFAVINRLGAHKALPLIGDIPLVLSTELYDDDGDFSLLLWDREQQSTFVMDGCHGNISFVYPKDQSKCFGNTLQFCDSSKNVEMPLLHSLVSAVTCVLREALRTFSPVEASDVLCDMLKPVISAYRNAETSDVSVNLKSLQYASRMACDGHVKVPDFG